MSKHREYRRIASLNGSLLLCAWAALSVFGGQESGQGVPPNREDVSGAVQKVRQALLSDPRFAQAASKLDARLGVAFALREAEAVDPGSVRAKQPESPASPPVVAIRRGGAAPVELTGLEGLPGSLSYERMNGEVAVAVVVQSLTPALLPEIARKHSARYEGAEIPAESATFVVPVSCLPGLLLDPDVSRVRAPVRQRPSLTNALPDTHTSAVHSTWNLHGSGAIYGAIDTGIDVTQMDFKADATHTRIAYLWDQTTTGTSPGPPSGFTYGREWTAALINAGSCTETSSNTADWGHGTSTSGVGAGNGSSGNGGYAGQADQADIVFVKTDLTDAHIQDAITYIRGRATALGKPVSINMSFGGGWGPHDGGDDLSYWMDNTSGISDSTQGVVLSAAAGNDTGTQGHVGGAICPENTSCSPCGSTDDTNTQAFSWDCSNQMQPLVMEWYLPALLSVEIRAWIPYYSKTSTGGAWGAYWAATGWLSITGSNPGTAYALSVTRKRTGCSTTSPCYDSYVGDGTTTTPGKMQVVLAWQKPMTDYHNSNLQYVYAEYDPATTTQSPTFGGDLCYNPGTGQRTAAIIQWRQNGGTGSGGRVDGYQVDSLNWGYFAAGATGVCRSGIVGDSYLNGNDDKMINGPAAAHTVLAVAGHVTRNAWTDKGGTPRSTTETLDAIASYSSLGPLRGISEGNAVVSDQKPNLSAPSEAVITSLSDDFAAGWYTSTPQSSYMPLETPINQHIAQEGTSFSSPQVAGAAAILLGAKPTLTLGQVRTDLQNGARSDANTGTVPNDTWGYGKLTLDSSLSFFATVVNRGTTPTGLTFLKVGVDNTASDAGAAGDANTYYYDVPSSAGSSLRVTRSGSDAVLSW